MAALLAIVSCSKESDLEINDLRADDLTFKATFEGSDSRVSIAEDGEGYKLAWSDDDQIAIYTRINKTKYAYNPDTQVFTKASDNSGARLEDYYYAVFPYSAASQVINDGVVTVDMPSVQAYVEKSFGKEANTMVAVCPKPAEASSEPVQLEFKNVAGYMRLYLYGEDITVKSIELTGNNDELLSGAANVGIIPDAMPEFTWVSTIGKKIILNCPEGVKLGTTAETATEFWFVVPPTTFEKGFSVRITDATDRVMLKTTESKVEVARNTVESMAALAVEYADADPNLLFDAQFNLDGTVTDRGFYNVEIERVVDANGKTPYMYTYTHPDYPHNNIVKFLRAASNIGDNNGGVGYTDNFYRANVTDKEDMWAKLQDGFTWEYIAYTPSDAWDIWAQPCGSNTFSILRKGQYHGNTFHLRPNGGQFTSSTPFTAGEFHHIVYIFDKAGETVYMYMDGVKKNSVGVSSLNETNYITIGGEPYKTSGAIHQPWSGDIAMMRIYDQVMTAEEVALRYESLSIPKKAVAQEVPKPMFDAKFNEDGTAENVGSMTSLTIETKANAELLNVVTNAGFTHNNIAKFSHEHKSSPESGYYLVDYSTNDEFKSKMTDGFYTLEVILSYDLALNTPYCGTNARAKAFGGDYERDWAANAGFDVIEGDENNVWPGFGIWYNQQRDSFISAAADSADSKPRCGNADSYSCVHKNYISQYIASKQYYHIVAVYDMYNHTNAIYVNGFLNNEGNEEHKGLGRTNLIGVNGALKLPDAAPNQQFYIGGDVEYFSGVPKLQNTWNGGVARARIYDEALSADQIATLYDEIKDGLEALNAAE